MLPKVALIQGIFYLAAIDLIYSLSGRISSVYLGDAGVELGLVALWTIGRRRT